MLKSDRDVEATWLQVNSSSRRARVVPPPEPVENVDTTLRPTQQTIGTYRSGSLPNVAAPQPTTTEPETKKVSHFGNLLQYPVFVVVVLFL